MSRFSGPNRPVPFTGLQQLISFALANPEFAEQLIANPGAAIHHISPAIKLSDKELSLLSQVQAATSLDTFAEHLHALIEDARRNLAGQSNDGNGWDRSTKADDLHDCDDIGLL